jgi:translocation and assembly module TamA
VLPGARFSRRRFRGAEVRPEEGYRFALEARGTDRAIGSDTGFVQFLASGNVLIPLPARLTVLSRVDSGYTLLNGPPEKIPVSLRFFAGGDHSVRGYDYQSLGPADNNGMVIGGRHLLAGSVEVERAIGEDWGVAAFYDAGNSFNGFSGLRLFQGVGIGVRYYTVVGPVRLDVARQIRVDDPSFRFHVSMGIEF